MKHTPGPWEHTTCGPNEWITAEGARIAFIGGKDGAFTAVHNVPHKANARLIAEAPELLEACKAAAEYLRFNQGNASAAYDALRAAIAKAEGK